MIKRVQKSLIRHLKTARDEESGVILLFAVVAGATLAASVATAVLLNFTGPRNEINNIQGNSAALEKINQAIVLSAIQSATYLLPCPASGAAGDGVSIGTCDTTANNIGTVPWQTLGLSEEDATDSYGNQIVYATSAGPIGACHELDGIPTGSVTAGTVRAGEDSPGATVLYALVSQGPNGRGAFDRDGNIKTSPTSTEESDNCAVGAGCTIPTANFIDTGPFEDDGGGASHFDDEVLLSSNVNFETECENFADMEKRELEFVKEGFGGTSVTSDLVVTNNGGGGGGSSTLGGGVLTVVADVELSTTSTLFTPSITPLYNRIEWTPTAATTNTGFSIITRADRTTRAGSTSNYTDGITCEFFSDGLPANAQTIEINDSSSTLATSGGTYTLTLDLTYELECFDDGNNVWARITEVGNTSNQATVFITDASDLSTPNQVIFLHSATSGAVSTLDNLLVAKGGVALELDSAGTLTDTTTPLALFASETSFTGEGWLYLRDTTAGDASLFRFDDNVSSSRSLIQADVANSEFEYSFIDLDTSTGDLVASSQTYGTTFWRHQTFNCDSGVDRRLYAFGVALGSVDTTTCDILPGATAAGTETVSIINNTGGRIVLSEMRVWEAAQTTAVITNNFNARVANNSTGLYSQLRLEDGFASATAVDANTPAGNYTVTNGRFVGFKAPFKTLAEDVCPGNVDPDDEFKCVWDGVGAAQTTDTITLPLDVTDVRIKVWGAGGGGGHIGNNDGKVGGGGGFSDGRLTMVGGTSIVTHDLNITAGGSGVFGVDNSSGGGGAGSAVQFDNNGTVTLISVAGGGGGGGSQRDDSTAGYAGGGTTGEVRNGGTTPAQGICDAFSGTQAGGGGVAALGVNCGTAGANDATVGGNVDLLNGGDGGRAETQNIGGTGGAGGTGYGNGGEGGDRAAVENGGGGGGGYTGGGGGTKNDNTSNDVGGGGGGSGFQTVDGGFTSVAFETGSSETPGGNADTDRGSAATGGEAFPNAGASGSPGRVVICWSTACLP